MIAHDYDRIREALEAAIQRPDEATEVRRRAIEAIAPYPAEVNEGYIVEAYQSGERVLQQSAIYAMGRTGQRRWVPEVAASLSSDNPAIRYEAATALGFIGEEDDVRLLVGVLQDDDLQVRASALIALGRIGGAAARRIVTREAGSKVPAIAEAAREALEEMGLGDSFMVEQPGVPGDLGTGHGSRNGGNGRN
jgi:hypothetical protein